MWPLRNSQSTVLKNSFCNKIHNYIVQRLSNTWTVFLIKCSKVFPSAFCIVIQFVVMYYKVCDYMFSDHNLLYNVTTVLLYLWGLLNSVFWHCTHVEFTGLLIIVKSLSSVIKWTFLALNAEATKYFIDAQLNS